jgi:hypothetical protein
MPIRSRTGVSVDGFVASPDGLHALWTMPGFVPGASHGFSEFLAGCDAVVMGRTTFVPALGAPSWPWPGLQVCTVASHQLPADTPADVFVAQGDPARLAQRLRSRASDGDVHLAGGPASPTRWRQPPAALQPDGPGRVVWPGPGLRAVRRTAPAAGLEQRLRSRIGSLNRPGIGPYRCPTCRLRSHV